MNNNSQETLHSVTQNDPSLTHLTLVDYYNCIDDGEFYSDNGDDYSTLGAAISNNTHLTNLTVVLSDGLDPLSLADRGIYDGLKYSSISRLRLSCIHDSQNIAGGVAQEILEVYQEHNNQLANLSIYNADLQNGGDRVIGDALRSCRNLQIVALTSCDISDKQLLQIVDSVRGHLQLVELYLYCNNIGNAGCNAIATLLADPNCNIQSLDLCDNSIGNEGATIITNSLLGNNTLWNLYLYHNLIDQSAESKFSRLLCNTSNIGSLYASNHTLKSLSLGGRQQGQHLTSLLVLNEDTNKRHVAIRKILKYHSNIDMEPMFEWDADGEQSLKALPYVMNWFERAGVAIADDDEEYGIEARELSAIFQFAKAMPLLFEGITRISMDIKKRKREDEMV